MQLSARGPLCPLTAQRPRREGLRRSPTTPRPGQRDTPGYRPRRAGVPDRAYPLSGSSVDRGCWGRGRFTRWRCRTGPAGRVGRAGGGARRGGSGRVQRVEHAEQSDPVHPGHPDGRSRRCDATGEHAVRGGHRGAASGRHGDADRAGRPEPGAAHPAGVGGRVMCRLEQRRAVALGRVRGGRLRPGPQGVQRRPARHRSQDQPVLRPAARRADAGRDDPRRGAGGRQARASPRRRRACWTPGSSTRSS